MASWESIGKLEKMVLSHDVVINNGLKNEMIEVKEGIKDLRKQLRGLTIGLPSVIIAMLTIFKFVL